MPIAVVFGIALALLVGVIIGHRLMARPVAERKRVAVAALVATVAAPLLLSGATIFVWAATFGGLMGAVVKRFEKRRTSVG
jgi:hypothetical protein